MMSFTTPPNWGESFTQGLERGSNIMDRLTQRKQRDAELAMRKQQLQQQQNLAPLQQQLLQEKLTQAQHANDPTYAIRKIKQMMQAFNGQEQQPMQQPMQQSGQGQQPMQQPMVHTPFGQIPLQQAMQFASAGINMPGLEKQITDISQMETVPLKTRGVEEQKAQIGSDTKRAEAMQGLQSSLDSINRIQQTMANYQKESKQMGYDPRYGANAEAITEPSAFKRYIGEGFNRMIHPVETLTHPKDALNVFSGEGEKMHRRYLSNLRGQLNELVNTKAKDLNTRFTEKEYEILQANKPSINDDATNLVAKLHAIEEAIRSGQKRLQAERQASKQGKQASETPFIVEQKAPQGKIGQQSVGRVQFADPNNPAYTIIKE